MGMGDGGRPACLSLARRARPPCPEPSGIDLGDLENRFRVLVRWSWVTSGPLGGFPFWLWVFYFFTGAFFFLFFLSSRSP